MPVLFTHISEHRSGPIFRLQMYVPGGLGPTQIFSDFVLTDLLVNLLIHYSRKPGSMIRICILQ